LLVDRFDNNDSSVPAFTSAATGQGRDAAQRNQFQGGKLKVLRGAWITSRLWVAATVWLSPILKNRQDSAGLITAMAFRIFCKSIRASAHWTICAS